MSIGQVLRDRCSRIVEIEKKKFEKKGLWNTCLAYFLLVSIIWVAQRIGKEIWPENVQNQTMFYIVGAFIIHQAAQILSFLFYLPGYLNWLPFYDKYKINKGSTWPWERTTWKLFLQKTIFNLIMNQCFVYPLILSFSSLIGLKQRFYDFPSFQEVFGQVLFVYFVEDFFFYWAHRFFHTFPVLYKMHKIHHQYDKIYTIVTEYFHPLDFGLANIMPSAMGFIILGSRAHCFTLFFWVGWKVMISTEGHSGYEFPWSPMRVLPLVSGPSYHDHHHSNNVGNFAGSCYFWDLMFRTSDPYWEEFLKDKK